MSKAKRRAEERQRRKATEEPPLQIDAPAEPPSPAKRLLNLLAVTAPLEDEAPKRQRGKR